jgi:hypothetical protein
VDLVTGVEGVEVLGLVEIPEHGNTILATGGAERPIRGDGDGVDVARVTDVVSLEAAGSELPNLLSPVSCILSDVVKINHDAEIAEKKENWASPSGIR